MTITKEERAGLRTAAEGATVGKPNGRASFVEDFESSERHKMLEDVVAWEFEAKNMHAEDFQFFLHFSPAKCLELLDTLEAAEARAESYERKTTMPCPHCDLSSGQRGGDRCPHCDGTGRVSVVPWLKADRDEWKARAEAVERERDLLIGRITKHRVCPPEKYRACLRGGRNIACKGCWLEWARQQAKTTKP